MAAPLEDDIALRIGLAVRALPGANARGLLRLLIRILGEPLTHARLQRLRAAPLRHALNRQFRSLDMTQFQQAYALLKGQGLQPVVVPGPVIESGVFCELSGSLRVACASGSGERIDGHFGNCPRFLIYQVAPDYIRLIDVREPAAVASRRGESDGNQQRASLIRDCTVLYTLSIGGPAVAKAVRAGLHPVKLTEPLPARNALLQLQAVLARDNPPPWLVRAMGAQPRPRPMSAD